MFLGIGYLLNGDFWWGSLTLFVMFVPFFITTLRRMMMGEKSLSYGIRHLPLMQGVRHEKVH